MKNFTKAKKRIIICIIELFLLVLFQNTVFAENIETQKVITPQKIKEWNDGATVTKESSGKGEDFEISVTADTNGLEEGYYSVYLYDYTTRSIKSYDGIRFNFKNRNATEMKINLSFAIDSKTSVTLADTSFAILESEVQNTHEVVNLKYGTISIPANFDGSVYIPFSQLHKEDGENVSLTKIQSWGITAIMSQNQQIEYTIGNIAFLTGSVDAIKESYYIFNLEGDSEITIPNTGSVIKNYQIEAKDVEGNPVNQDITFYMVEEVTGVTITKDGKLEIESDCTASEITICAKTEKSINYGTLKISLNHSSTQITATGVPTAVQVPKITSTIYTKLNKNVMIIRVFLGGIALVFTIIFFEWFSVAKMNYEIIKSKLNKIYKEQEEEEE